jgi:hypothetical protein
MKRSDHIDSYPLLFSLIYQTSTEMKLRVSIVCYMEKEVIYEFGYWVFRFGEYGAANGQQIDGCRE